MSQRKTLEQLREYFVNPSDAASAEDLARMGAEAIEVMAQIFVSGGDLSKVNPDLHAWIAASDQAEDVREIVRRILAHETRTRRFDNLSMAQIHPQGNKVGILSMLIAAYMNTNTIVKEVSRGEHIMEAEAIRWLCEIFDYNTQEASGNIVSGGSTANLAALWVARDLKWRQFGWNDGDEPRSKLVVLANEYRHYSIYKACHILGMRLEKLPAAGFKTDVGGLREKLEKLSEEKLRGVAAVVALAGETETGLVDDIEAIAKICREFGIYLHVDAAYGGPFVLSRRGDLFKGIEKADSIVVDPHKLMWTPYPAGVVLFKNRAQHALIQNGARYLQASTNSGLMGEESERNFGLSARVEGSMGAGGVISTWATIKLFGREGLATLLDHTLDMAEFAYGRVQCSQILRAVHTPELNEFLVGLNHFNRGIGKLSPGRYNEVMMLAKVYVDQVQGAYISVNEDVDQGLSAWRFIVVHPHTTSANIESLFANLEMAVDRLVTGDIAFEQEIKQIVAREKGWIR